MKSMGERKRAVRSDKKRDVRPYGPLTMYECLSRIEYITKRPMKDILEELCMRGIKSKHVMEILSSDFKRDFEFSKYTIYIGDSTKFKGPFKIQGPKKRLTVRFTQKFHDRLAELAFSLDRSVSATTTLLLEKTLKNSEQVNALIGRYIVSELDENRMKQLKEVYKFIRKENLYDEPVTFAQFISYLYEELKCSSHTFKEKLNTWIDQVNN